MRSSTKRRAPSFDVEEHASCTVTRLEFQRRAGSDRLNVFLDDEFAFSLASRIAASLHEGDTLDTDALRSLQQQDDVERAYAHALYFLAVRPRSAFEVRRRLAAHQHGAAAIAAVLERLQLEGLLDDSGFAQYWVEQRLTFRPRGPKAIRAELRAKGLSSEDASEAVQIAEAGQDDAAYAAASRRAARLSVDAQGDFRHALNSFLERRGFDFACARRTVDRLISELGVGVA